MHKCRTSTFSRLPCCALHSRRQMEHASTGGDGVRRAPGRGSYPQGLLITLWTIASPWCGRMQRTSEKEEIMGEIEKQSLLNQLLANLSRAGLGQDILFSKRKKMCISGFSSTGKGRVASLMRPQRACNWLATWPQQAFFSDGQRSTPGLHRPAAQARCARLCAWTASTIAATDSGAVNCEMPWPRLNTWPWPAPGLP